MPETEKVYAPKPKEHPVEVDLAHVNPDRLGEVKGLILKNHLPNVPFSVQFPDEVLLKVAEVKVEGNDFKVFAEVERAGQKIDTVSPWVFSDVSIKVHNGTWDKETETENLEVDYRRAFENLVVPKLQEHKLV